MNRVTTWALLAVIAGGLLGAPRAIANNANQQVYGLRNAAGQIQVTNAAGTVISDQTYAQAYEDGGYLLVAVFPDPDKPRLIKWGIVGPDGRQITDLVYDVQPAIHGSVAIVRQGVAPDDKWGLVSLPSGQTLVPLTYDYIAGFHHGVAVCWRDQGKDKLYGYLRDDGREIVPCQYTITFDFDSGRGVAKKGALETLVYDRDGRVVWRPANSLIGYSDGLARGSDAGQVVFFDPDGNAVVRVDPALRPWSFKDGRALINTDGKWGFIDKTGKQIVPPTYDHIREFERALAQFKQGGLYGVIENSGKIILEAKYKSIEINSGGYMIAESAEHRGHHALFSRHGHQVIPMGPQRFKFTRYDLTLVQKNGLWGATTTTGKWVIPTLYAQAPLVCGATIKAQRLIAPNTSIDVLITREAPVPHSAVQLPTGLLEALSYDTLADAPPPLLPSAQQLTQEQVDALLAADKAYQDGDVAGSIKQFQALADQKIAAACGRIGWHQYTGIGMAKNRADVYDTVLPGILKSEPVSLYLSGRMLLDPDHEPTNLVRGAEYMEDGVRGGVTAGLRRWALLYLDGQVYQPQPDMAMSIMLNARDTKTPHDLLAAGLMLLYGVGIEKNGELGSLMLELAAPQLPEANYRLGVYYGEMDNIQKQRLHYTMAADAGHADAKTALAALPKVE